MANLTLAAVQAQMQQVSVSQEDRQKAKRALETWSKEQKLTATVDEDLVKMYLAVKVLLPEGKKVTPALMNTFKKEIKNTFALGCRFWMQWRSVLPVLPEKYKKFLVDPTSLPDFPSNTSPIDVWVIQGKCNVDDFGDNPSYIKSEASTVRTLDAAAAGSAARNPDDGGGAPVGTDTQAANGARRTRGSS